jgi:hypothetical protein
LPAGAEATDAATWRLVFPENERAARLATLPPGAEILRLERQRVALEDYFVARIRAFHGAGFKLGEG